MLDAVEHLVGMQSQVPIDPYVGLWSRLEDFDPDELGQAMLERRAVRMTLLRTTLHLVTARDALALRPVVQNMIERRFDTGTPFGPNVADIDRDELLAAGAQLLEDPQGVSELGKALAERFPGHDPSSLGYAIAILLPVVQVTPRGVWRRTLRPKLATLAGWLGLPVPTASPPDDAIMRYLCAFGPATISDIRTWSGLAGLREAIDRLRPRLRTYRDELGRVLIDAEDGIFTAPDTAAPPRFLPQYDNILLSHDDRSRVVGDRRLPLGPTWKGNLLVDGFLGGTWRLRTERGGAVLTVEIDATRKRALRAEVEAEGERLLKFLTPDAISRRLAVVR
ncbi:MAG: hypothetical protein QOG21_2438 [Actinomycetota bacterium]|nr:hypothetical protein [Actinomycetota bacterium]